MAQRAAQLTDQRMKWAPTEQAPTLTSTLTLTLTLTLILTPNPIPHQHMRHGTACSTRPPAHTLRPAVTAGWVGPGLAGV